MEYLSANLAGRTRRETLNGLEYVVAPMTLIVSGVLNGSKGPLFYPPEEVERNPSVWNGVPLIVYHPSDKGQPSARDPEVLNAQGIGYIFRAKAQGGRLTAEGWFDVKAVLRVDNRILQAIQNDKPLELSTGLHTDDEKAAEGANHDGTAYDATARNYRPDHVAILPDMTGACSVADGCGVLNTDLKQVMDAYLTANNLPLEEEKDMAKLTDEKRKALVDDLITNVCCWEEGDRETLNAFDDARLTKMTEDAKKDVEQLAVHNAAVKGWSDPGGNEHTWNAEKNEWETKVKAPTKKKDDLVKNQDPKPQTDEEWYAAAPEGVANTFKHARELENKAKERCVEQLTANIKDEQEQAKQATRLMKRSLVDLEADAALVPAQPQRAFPDFAGQASPARQTQNKNHPKFGLPKDYLPQDDKK